MKKINELLDRAKLRANLPSDYALHKATGIPQNVISLWRKGKRHPSNEEAVKIATLAGIDEMEVIAEIELETANTEAKKEFWKNYLEKRGIAACLTLTALALTITAAPEPATAGVLQMQNYGADFYLTRDKNIHYAQLTNSYKRLILKALCCKWLQLVKTITEQLCTPFLMKSR